jgi:hypothetical protein
MLSTDNILTDNIMISTDMLLSDNMFPDHKIFSDNMLAAYNIAYTDSLNL